MFVPARNYLDQQAATRDASTFTSGAGITLDDLGTSMIPMLLTLDPPRHDELRRLASRAFTPRRVAAMEEVVRGSARACIAAALERGGGDLVDVLAARVPMDTIAAMIGVPTADLPTFRGWIRRMFGVDPGSGDVSPEVATTT